MDIQLPFSFLVFLVALFYLFTKLRTTKPEALNLPPQPWKLPIIGHLHHLSGSLPHRAFANLAQKLGPIIHLQLGELKAVVISSPDLAKQIMITEELNFTNRPQLLSAEIIGYNCAGIAFSRYGDYWRQMRKICILELLSAKKVKSFESIRDQESWNVVDAIMKQSPEPVNVTEKIFTMTNVITIRVAAGSICKDQAMFLKLVKEVFSLSDGFDVYDLFPSQKLMQLIMGPRKKFVKYHHMIDKMLDEIISEHQELRASGQTDDNNILDVLLRLKDDDGLQVPITYVHIKAVLLDMFGAGTDTSSVTIEWAMFELMKNLRIMNKVQTELRHVLKGKKMIYESDIKDLSYLKLVIKETLRLHPPLAFFPRECLKTCKIGGYDIPANAKVIINAWKIERDPDYWIDPESFIPERFNDGLIDFKGANLNYLPFGTGRRMCPGMTLGLANVELPLARLLYHFNWELPNGVNVEDLDTTESFGLTLKRRVNLILVPRVYNTN